MKKGVMKNFIKLSLLFGGLLFLGACESTSGPYNSGPYGKVYRAPDGGTYRHGDIYTDRNGNIYRNGKIYRKAMKPKKLPPGQAKKIFGGKAKDYAPGHQKHKHKKGPKHHKHDHH